MDDRNGFKYEQSLRIYPVQIPLWTIGTQAMEAEEKCKEYVQIPLWTIGTQAMEAEEKCKEYVQIPLWTIGTRKRQRFQAALLCSDSSMDDRNYNTNYIETIR